MLARVARLMCVSNKFLAGEMMQDALQLSKSIREIKIFNGAPGNV